MTKIIELNNTATQKERLARMVADNRRKEKAQNIIAWLIAVAGLAVILLLADTDRGLAASNNQHIKDCLIAFDGNFNKASYCAQRKINEEIRYNEEELREYLKENPRYRVPGQSLNRCYGKEEVTIHTHATKEENANGTEITWYYRPEVKKCNPHTGE